MNRGIHPHQVQDALVRCVVENLVVDWVSSNQIVIRTGSTVGSDNGAAIISVLSDITVDITVSGVNGLDTGIEAANTWYYIYIIWSPSSGLVRGLLSTSATSPVLPSGYTSKRLIGAVYNHASSDFWWFTQVGKHVQYYDQFQVFAGIVPSNWTPISTATFVPPISRDAELSIYTQIGGAALDVVLYIRPGVWGGPGANGILFLYKDITPSNNDEASWKRILLDSNQVFSVYATGNQAGGTFIDVFGFYLNL